MSGLRKLCKMYGRLKVTAGDETKEYKWDHKHDKPVDALLLKDGSARWKESEKAKWEKIMEEE